MRFLADSTDPTKPSYSPFGTLANAKLSIFSGSKTPQIVLNRIYDKRGRSLTETYTNAANAALYIYNLGALSNGKEGYDVAGNVTGFQDSVMGEWNFGYDPLNRLSSATGVSGTFNGTALAGATQTFIYDSFGNRKNQNAGGTALAPVEWATYQPTTNRMATSNEAPGGVSIDVNGRTLSDGRNNYLWEAQGWLCGVTTGVGTSVVGYYQYIYDASGNFITPAARANPGCDLHVTPLADFVLDQNGKQVTQATGTGAWQHTNVFVNGELLATYDSNGTHFALSDWQQTKRVQVSATGVIERRCWNFPFNDAYTCSGGTDATEHHYTGTIRDDVAGTDYFGARWFAHWSGRFLSPDPSGLYFADLMNPQSFNLYSYVQNNPLSNTDPDGYDCVYLNNSGSGVESVDSNSSRGECSGDSSQKGTGGYWVDGTATNVNLFTNSNDVGLGGYTSAANGSRVSTDAYYTSATGANSDLVSGMGYTGLTGTVDLVQLYSNRPNVGNIYATSRVDVAAGCVGSGALGIASDLSGYGLLHDMQSSAMKGSLNPVLNSGDKLNDAGNAIDVAGRAAEALKKTLPFLGPVAKKLGPVGTTISVVKAGRDFYNCVN